LADLEKHASIGRGRLPYPWKGMLDPCEAAKRVSIDRFEPSRDLMPFLDRIWIMKWDLRGSRAEEQRFLPSPNSHFVIGLGRATLVGVKRKVHSSVFEGAGRAIGLRFRAGGLRPFLTGPVAWLTDREVSATVLTGVADETVDTTISAVERDDAMIDCAEAFLRARLPKSDPMVDLACTAVDLARRKDGPLRAEELADQLGVSLRSLQRLFLEYVGVSPKWVIRRYRLQEAAWRLSQGANEPLAHLAADLGYFDQAHLARDFAAVLGCSPSDYRERQRA
jgi:AraC-like DNA-binding protein